MELSIALVQLDITGPSGREPRPRMDQFVRQVKKQGADLVVLPKLPFSC